MSRLLPEAAGAVPVSTEAEAHSYIAGVCFKHGPPSHLGIELEWFLSDPHDPARTPTAELLRSALGPYAPVSLVPETEPAALPGGSLVTVEPGGQIEISTPPATSAGALIDLVRADIAALDRLLHPAGLERTVRAPLTPRARVLSTPRYEAMERAFDDIGPYGRRMMCGSAATQICLDLGPVEQADARWRLAHGLGPVLLAAFATSSTPHGPVSSRMHSWWRLDPPRTAPPVSLGPADYVERVLDTPVLAVRNTADAAHTADSWTVDNRHSPRQWLASGRPLTTGDLDVHLSTMFPPVRPQGYLELRWLDAQTDEDWAPVLLIVAALFHRASTVQAALDALGPAAGRWQPATDIGLRDPALALAARRLCDLLGPALAALAADDPHLHPLTIARAERLAGRRLVERITPAAESHTDAAADAAS